MSLTYTSLIEEIERFLPEHIEYLDAHYASGQFQLSGRKVPRTGGVIIATVKSREALELILAKDPFYREKLANYEITEMVPTKSSAALAFLVES
ncbi:MAG: YciI family protein [Oceanobacter sp.]